MRKLIKTIAGRDCEVFAHMYEAQFSSDRYALMQKYFPSALAEFENLLNGVI